MEPLRIDRGVKGLSTSIPMFIVFQVCIKSIVQTNIYAATQME